MPTTQKGFLRLSIHLAILLSIFSFMGCNKGGGADTSLADSDSSQATLNWVAPNSRTDGSVLEMSEIGGYRIYAGDSSDALVAVHTIQDPYVMSYTFSNLTSGTHYFSVGTFDTQGLESAPSTVVSKTTPSS